MNEGHRQFLASPEWAEMLRTDLLPWVRDAIDLGDDVLEVGPGPGLTTDFLRELAPKVTAVEIDDDLADKLAARLAGTNVEVVHADASASGLPSDRFSAATCFSMLHHVPSAELQDRVFAEVHRMLRPGGAFVGVDALDLELLRAGHVDDTFVPVGLDTIEARFEAAGFTGVVIEPSDYQFRFTATKPARG